MIDHKGQFEDMTESNHAGEDLELKAVLGAWGSPQTPASLKERVKVSYSHHMHRNPFQGARFFYWIIGIIVIAASASGVWLAIRNSTSAPTVSTTPVAPETAPIPKSAESVTPVSPQRVVPIQPPGRNSPNTITVNFIKDEGSLIKLDRLDGHSITLEADNLKYVSTPIAIDDEAVRGVCKLVGVPPGNYLLKIFRINMSAKITIPAQNKPVTIVITFRSTGALDLRTK